MSARSTVMGNLAVIRTETPSQPSPALSKHKISWLRITITVLSLTLLIAVGFLIAHGFSYYTTPVTQRYLSPLHKELKPGGYIGHFLGVTGSCMMIGLLAYSLRKRVYFMRNWGKLSHWLNFHIFLGVAGPILITFHTAFKLRGIVAISYWSMMIVFVSGIIGKYLYIQINNAISDSTFQFEELRKQIDLTNQRLASLLTSSHLQQVNKIADFHSDPSLSPFRAGLLMLFHDLRWLIRKRALHRILNTARLTNQERHDIYLLARTRELQLRRIALLRSSQQLFKYWHIIHLPLAQTMYFTMAIHVVVAILTGYL